MEISNIIFKIGSYLQFSSYKIYKDLQQRCAFKLRIETLIYKILRKSIKYNFINHILDSLLKNMF